MTTTDTYTTEATIRTRTWGRYMTAREYHKKPRVYVAPKGENLLANIANRTSRPTKVYREIAKQALAELGVAGKLRWSQYAGCTCPCSPGFVLDLDREATTAELPANYDIHITAELPAQEPTAEGLARAGQVIADPTLPDLTEYAV